MTQPTAPDEILCIVDRSGSMSSIADDAIGGFNTFLESQKTADKNGLLTLVLFDHEFTPVYRSIPLEKAPALDRTTFVPRGMTALYDAVGRTLSIARSDLLARPADRRPSGVTVAILTDGMENYSQEFTGPMIASLIEDVRKEHGWEFVFLAANQDAMLAAQTMNIPAADARAFEATSQGIHQAYASMDAMVAEKRRAWKHRPDR